MYGKIAHLKFKSLPEQRFVRDGFLGKFGRSVDLLDQYEKKLEELEDNLTKEKSSLIGTVRLLSNSAINISLNYIWMYIRKI